MSEKPTVKFEDGMDSPHNPMIIMVAGIASFIRRKWYILLTTILIIVTIMGLSIWRWGGL